MSSFKIISLSESSRWGKIILSFPQYDVYYLSNYGKVFMIHGDGEPLLLNYETDELRGVNVVMKSDISQFAPFKGIITPETYFDIVTPYGYGGFLFEGDTSESAMNRFSENYTELLNNEHIISEFVRYHPQLKNANALRSFSTVIDLGQTISMDLRSEDEIWANINSKNRNMIRKAQKSGIEIHHGKSLDLLDSFMNIYNATMEKDNADPYYFFEKEFYKSIHTDLYNNYEIFYAVLGGKIIAISIMLFANNRMHYHLSGSLFEYRKLAPTNLLLFEAARWGNKQGFKTFHLGGGIGSGEDNLFKFKQAFNRNSSNLFSIGKKVYNQKMYNCLVELRKEINNTFNFNSSFFPLYRA
jgi:Acetyltransferase (GNAT) domain